MNKKVASEIAVGVILLIAVIVGGVFWMQNRNTSSIQPTETQKTTSAISNTQTPKSAADNIQENAKKLNIKSIGLYDMSGSPLKQTEDSANDFPVNTPLTFRISFDQNSQIKKESVGVEIKGLNSVKITNLKDSPKNFRLSPFEYIAVYTPKNVGKDVVNIFVENQLVYTVNFDIYGYYQTADNIYKSEKYDFSLQFPKGWYYREIKDVYTKESDITFTNVNKPMGKDQSCPNCLSFSVRIFNKSNPEHVESFNDRISYTEKNYDKKENIVLQNGSPVDFHILTYDNKDKNAIQDLILPEAEAHYQNAQYAFEFDIATEIELGPDGQQKEVDFMRQSLKTLRPLR